MTTSQRTRARAFTQDAQAGSFRAEAASDDVARVYLYAPIGGWFGIWAEDFVRAINDIDAKTLELHVNSPGGDAFDGVAMMNALRQHDAKVIAYVDGLAASAASIVILGADEIVMSPGSELMIHDPWAVAVGDAAEMDRTRARLDKIAGSMAGLYADRADGTPAEWREVMLAETWYTADEAVTAGLADRVDKDDDDTATSTDKDGAKAAWDLSMFAHAGRSRAPAPLIPAAALAAAATRGPSGSGSTPPAAPGGTTEGSTIVPLTDAQMATLRQKLGVTDADADGDTLLAALDEALEERADDHEDDVVDGETTPTTTAPPEGMELVDSEALAQMRADAAAGREARNEQLAARRTATVDAAVKDGRIPPTRRDHWLAQLEADPGSEEHLNGLAKGLVNLEEVGSAGGVDLDDDKILARANGWDDDETEEA